MKVTQVNRGNGDVNLYRELALLTDAQAEHCLNDILRTLAIQEPKYAEIFDRPTEMQKIVESVAHDVDTPLANVGEVAPEYRPTAIRAILIEIAEDARLNPRLQNWFKTARSTLIVDPVTSAIVLAGIVMVLSTHVSITYKEENGERTNLEVKLEKKPTTERILEKFFSLFQP